MRKKGHRPALEEQVAAAPYANEKCLNRNDQPCEPASEGARRGINPLSGVLFLTRTARLRMAPR